MSAKVQALEFISHVVRRCQRINRSVARSVITSTTSRRFLHWRSVHRPSPDEADEIRQRTPMADIAGMPTEVIWMH
jgi:hypothetical protein